MSFLVQEETNSKLLARCNDGEPLNRYVVHNARELFELREQVPHVEYIYAQFNIFAKKYYLGMFKECRFLTCVGPFQEVDVIDHINANLIYLDAPNFEVKMIRNLKFLRAHKIDISNGIPSTLNHCIGYIDEIWEVNLKKSASSLLFDRIRITKYNGRQHMFIPWRKWNFIVPFDEIISLRLDIPLHAIGKISKSSIKLIHSTLNGKIECEFPPTLRVLKLPMYNQATIPNIPASVEHLELNVYQGELNLPMGHKFKSIRINC